MTQANLTIANISISQNESGLYSANDLHKASGGEQKHKPIHFIELPRTIRFIELLKVDMPTFLETTRGCAGGTFMSKELLTQYASWISPEIDLMVTRAFLESIKPLSPAEQLLASVQLSVDNERRITATELRLKELEAKSAHTDHIFHFGEYTSIKAYSNVNKIELTPQGSLQLGKACTKHCKEYDIKINKLPCPIFGQVNAYPKEVIEYLLENDS